jgi:protein gp37
MANNSHIEWTEATWNPITGCTKISPGCKNCYANRMAMRLKAIGQPNYRNGFELTLHEQMLSMPSKWSRSRTIFVNSMSDLFHQDVPRAFIHRVFSAMHQANWHQYQILTKRSDRLLALMTLRGLLTFGWESASKIRITPSESIICGAQLAHLKFLSLEPLLGPLPELDLSGIDWVVVGGESGPRARPIEATWVRDIRDQCLNQHVPFFFKQWGGVFKKRNGRLLEGRTWDQMPMVSPSPDQLRRQPKAPLADPSGAGYLRNA